MDRRISATFPEMTDQPFRHNFLRVVCVCLGCNCPIRPDPVPERERSHGPERQEGEEGDKRRRRGTSGTELKDYDDATVALRVEEEEGQCWTLGLGQFLLQRNCDSDWF